MTTDTTPFRDELAKQFNEFGHEVTLKLLNLFTKFLQDRQKYLESVDADFDQKRLIHARLDEIANVQLMINAGKKGLER